MFAVIRRYRVDPSSTEGVVERVRDELLTPLEEQVAGFEGYYVVDGGDGVVVGVGLFAGRADAEVFERLAGERVRQVLGGLPVELLDETAGDAREQRARGR